MKTWKAGLIALAALAAFPAAASADACECVGGAYPPWGAPPPPAYAPPPGYYPAPIVVAPMYQRERRIGLGIRATGMSVVDSEARGDAEPLGLSGGGIYMRFRGRGHWGLELAIDGAATEDKDSWQLGYQRVTGIASASIFYRFQPRARFDWHLLLGIGGGSTELRYGADSETEPTHTETFAQSEGHVGIGFEWKLGRRQAWAISGDLRFMGLHLERDDEVRIAAVETDKALIVPSIPENESGATAHLGISYYF